MNTWQKLVAVAAVMVVLSGGGIAVAKAMQDPATPAPIQPGSGKVFASGTPTSTYTAITPCRIVDTRVAGGPVGSNQSRGFRVVGTASFPLQGGKSGGCGIPTTGVSAIEVAVTAVDATGGGYMRIYPSGQPEPTATFINYSPFDPTNTGAVTICQSGCPAGQQVTVKGHGTSTDVVMDVQGYYSKPLTAKVDFDGNLLEGSRVVSVTKVGSTSYDVVFNRDVSNCTYQASSTFAAEFAQPLTGNASNKVSVFTYGDNAAAEGAGFFLTVTC